MNPINKFPYLSLIMLLFIVTEIVSVFIYPQLLMVTKCMLMVTLLGYYLLSAKHQDNLFILGIVFGAISDFFLAFSESDTLFLTGLLTFCVMLICYTSVFFKKKRQNINQKDWITLVPIVAIPASIMIFVLWENLGYFKLPGLVHLTLSIIFLVFSYLRDSSLASYRRVFLGSITFVLGCAMFAINKFITKIPHIDIYQIFVYISSQFLIISGLVRETHQLYRLNKYNLGTFKRYKNNSHA